MIHSVIVPHWSLPAWQSTPTHSCHLNSRIIVSHTTVTPTVLSDTHNFTHHFSSGYGSLPLSPHTHTHTLAFTTTPVLVFQHTIFTPSSLFLARALTSSRLGSCQTYNRPLTIPTDPSPSSQSLSYTSQELKHISSSSSPPSPLLLLLLPSQTVQSTLGGPPPNYLNLTHRQRFASPIMRDGNIVFL